MSRTSKRHTQIDFQSIRNLQGTLLPQENEYGTPDKPMQVADELRTVQDAHSRGEISSTAPSIETPLDAHGETSSTSPWSTYKQIYDLRLGNDFYVTVAEEMAFPYKEVFMRPFVSTNVNQLRLIQQVRHPNLVTILDAFRHDNKTLVVFESMPVSLRDIATSSLGVDTIRLAAILGQVCVSQSRWPNRTFAYYFRLSTALHISPNSAWSMARLHAPMFWLIETGR